jgi:serine/threonine protein kinase
MALKVEEPISRVHVSKKVSSGSYGTVYTIRESSYLVVKRNYIDKMIDNMGMIRETDIANHLNGHPCIVELKTICLGCPFVHPERSDTQISGTKDDVIYAFFERSPVDVYNVYNRLMKNPLRMKESFAQILLALEFMHSKGYVHQDVKPNNFLWFSAREDPFLIESRTSKDSDKGWLKLCDFGLSRPYVSSDMCNFTLSHVDYRAPEISSEINYDYKIDIWSAACVILEILTGEVFFSFRRNYDKKRRTKMSPADEAKTVLEQVIRDTSLINTPEIIVRLINRDSDFSHDPSGIKRSIANFFTLEKVEEIQKYQSRFLTPLTDIKAFNSVNGSYDDFVDLILRMLHFDPRKRISATEALNHRFFSGMRKVIDRIRSNYPPTLDYPEIITITFSRYRQVACSLILNEIVDGVRPLWFSWHKIFFGLQIFDNYTNRSGEMREMIHKQLGDMDLVARFEIVSSLYLSHKYLSQSDKINWSFQMFAEKYLPIVEDIDIWLQGVFESYIVRLFSGKIYNQTFLQAADNFGYKNLNDSEMMGFLNYYCGITSSYTFNIYEIFVDFLKKEKLQHVS